MEIKNSNEIFGSIKMSMMRADLDLEGKEQSEAITKIITEGKEKRWVSIESLHRFIKDNMVRAKMDNLRSSDVVRVFLLWEALEEEVKEDETK